MSRIVPEVGLNYLYEDVGEQIHSELLEAIIPGNGASRIADILQWADSETVKDDLQRYNRDMTQDKLAHPVVHYLTTAMIEAIDDGSWSINVPGARVFVSNEDDVFVFWDAASLDIHVLTSDSFGTAVSELKDVKCEARVLEGEYHDLQKDYCRPLDLHETFCYEAILASKRLARRRFRLMFRKDLFRLRLHLARPSNHR